MDVTLKEKFSLDNFFVEEVNEWIQGKHRIPKIDKILKCLEKSEKTKDLYPLASIIYLSLESTVPDGI